MNRKKWKDIFVQIGIVIGTGVLSFGTTYLYGCTMLETIRNTVVLLVAAICISFGWTYGKVIHNLLYNNELHLSRFAFFYMIGLLFACFLPLFPYSVWPVLAFAVALSFFSNAFIGTLSYLTILMLPILIADAPVGIFLFYFLSGLVGILVFQSLDEAYKVGIPITITLLFFIISETATIVLFINEQLSWQMFIFPFLNLFFNLLLLICVLKYFSFSIVHKFRTRFMEINDPEFVLMADLKNKSKDDYFLALHTAYFSERIATAIGADVALTKSCAYYHRFGKIERLLHNRKEKESEILEEICEKNNFPPGVSDVLLECANRNYVSKESTIVMYSDAIVTSVLYLIHKDTENKPDYGQVIDLIFKKKEEGGSLRNSKITVHDLIEMKQVFIREKLYYDFLS